MRHLLTVDDLSDEEIRAVLDDAAAIDQGRSIERPRPSVVGLVFHTPSLRTRTGFAVAASRLGGAWVDAGGLRQTPDMSEAESFDDQLRTMTGMCDVVVVRVPFSLVRDVVALNAACPVINGGDGPRGEHPSQALIDLSFIELERGSIDQLRIGVVGDLTARSVRSFISLLGRFVPRELRLIGPPTRQDHGVAVSPALAEVTTARDTLELHGLDVVSFAGLPRGVDDPLDPGARSAYALDARGLDALEPDAVVLSPMPVIDEISPEARTDPRVVFHRQSDGAVAVRMALLRMLAG